MNPTLQSLKPGEFLFSEGDPCNGVFIVREGSIDIVREKDGVSVCIGTMGVGDVIGTVTLFSRDTRTASARAHSAAQVVHVDIETIEGSFKNLPVWVQAVLKDSVARLKSANDQLLEAKVNERKLQLKLGTSFHAASQFAAFLGYAIRVGTIKDEGLELFPLRGIVERCEGLFLKRSSYFDGMLDCFVKGSLVKIQDDKKWGHSLFAPQAALMEDFANFALACSKNEFAGFVPTKHVNLLSALVRLSRKPDAKEFYTRAEICERLQKESAKVINDVLFDEFVKLRVISATPGADRFSWNERQVQKRLIFESTARLLKDLSEEGAVNRAA
ncbi:MAG: cyclic nucleotide-binding domain-containing protein [Betaproteobacteria bacterium]|nr:cyclic nucleotide-binding domain-containing protein [Betaproteobacteria bacterium]